MATITTSSHWHSIVSAFLEGNPEFEKYGRPATPLVPQFPDSMKRFAYFITYQAFNVRSCNSMWDQLVDLVDHLLLSLNADTYSVWPPRVLLNIPDNELYGQAGVGLSRNKISAIKGMARFLMRNPDVYDPRRSSSEIIRTISDQIKGVGPFTVASFLIESGRLDIANYYDRVMRKGLMIHYKLGKVPTIKQATRLTATWGRYKTVGTKYMFYVANRPPRMPECMCHMYELASRRT